MISNSLSNCHELGSRRHGFGVTNRGVQEGFLRVQPQPRGIVRVTDNEGCLTLSNPLSLTTSDTVLASTVKHQSARIRSGVGRTVLSVDPTQVRVRHRHENLRAFLIFRVYTTPVLEGTRPEVLWTGRGILLFILQALEGLRGPLHRIDCHDGTYGRWRLDAWCLGDLSAVAPESPPLRPGQAARMYAAPLRRSEDRVSAHDHRLSYTAACRTCPHARRGQLRISTLSSRSQKPNALSRY